MISFCDPIAGMRAKKRMGGSAHERWRGRTIVLFLALCCVGDAFAQQPWGVIVGTVTDPTSATISPARVTVTQTDTQVNQTVVTNATGDYSVPYLVHGMYTIKVEHPGFRASVVSHVVLEAAQTVRVDVHMQLGEVTEVSEVSATAIAVQMDSAVVGTTIDSKTVNDLPLNGRTFAQLATLVPGVAAQGSLNIGTQRQRGSIGTAFAITANGFSDVQNNFIYDGEPAMDLDISPFLPRLMRLQSSGFKPTRIPPRMAVHRVLRSTL
jgi:carboxypeptidase family protein